MMVLNQLVERSERPRKPDVVAIEKGNVIAQCLFGTQIACSSWSAIWLVQHFNAATKGCDVVHRAVS